MKKLFFALMCMLAWSSSPAFADGTPIGLTMERIDDTPHLPDKSKAPMRIPTIYQDGYTLTLPPAHPEYIIHLVQGNEIVYTSIIPTGTNEYELPSYLSGEYTIQFIFGNYCLTGFIAL